MGGCRCTFRSCTVNTLKFPGMHFFHYPIKNKDRLALWVGYANYPEIHQLAYGQAKNKVVCALHFRDECFMNYKKDRLIPHAIPTLSRLKNGLVLDHSVKGIPEPEQLPLPVQKHLIAPKGYVPLGLPEENLIDAGVEMLKEEEEGNNRPLKRLRITKMSVAPTILNKGIHSASDSSNNGYFKEDDVPSITLSNEPFEEEEQEEEEEYGIVLQSNGDLTSETLASAADVDEIMDLNDIELLPAPKEHCIEVESENISRTVYEQTVETFERELIELKEECEKKELEAETRVAQLEMELAAAKEANQLATSKAEAAESSAKVLQEKMEACLAKNRQLSEAAVMAQEKPTTTSSTGPMTKAQLFNGIKKYLSASMTALVRMEVFGGSERQWKPDEKQASVELLRLGDKVYEYFSDEWRFRLPPKKLVRDWTNEVTVEDEDDL